MRLQYKCFHIPCLAPWSHSTAARESNVACFLGCVETQAAKRTHEARAERHDWAVAPHKYDASSWWKPREKIKADATRSKCFSYSPRVGISTYNPKRFVCLLPSPIPLLVWTCVWAWNEDVSSQRKRPTYRQALFQARREILAEAVYTREGERKIHDDLFAFNSNTGGSSDLLKHFSTFVSNRSGFDMFTNCP